MEIGNLAAGQKFGRLTAVRFVGRNTQYNAIWRWRCDCGKEKDILANRVIRGKTQSCSCLLREKTAEMGRATKKHGMWKSAEYGAYQQMKHRCCNSNNPEYHHYGGRGIKVCARWLGDDGFVNFYADMGPRPSKKHSIDRKENDDDYTPKNCHWGTQKDQHDHRRTTIWITCCGVKKTLVDWAKEMGVSRQILYWRYKRGLSPAEILSPTRINSSDTR